MEIQALKLFITDADLSSLLADAIAGQDGIEGLLLHLTPEGALVQGQYATGFGFKVPFETLWQVKPAGPSLQVQLASIKVGGMPANLLRGALLRLLRDTFSEQPGVHLQEETIVVDVPVIARTQGIELQVDFTTVRMSVGSAVIEAAL